ncbi:MAG: transcriptional repressor NrdR [Parcubacteria group bacterium Gr01-1014_38]|nr:MAG: transcriptional repressor NrdR [Parcubacteria group bacterium Gr01-1014_38]
MHCPACNTEETKVVDSRVVERGTAVRRRRECEKCGHRFSTYEQVELPRLVVVKKDGRREPYQRVKIESGIRKALEKRPVPERRVREMLAEIERELQARGEEEVGSRVIGEMVMRALQELDEVAYIRFASVYKAFRDADTFQEELKHLRKTSRPRRFRRSR